MPLRFKYQTIVSNWRDIGALDAKRRTGVSVKGAEERISVI